MSLYLFALLLGLSGLVSMALLGLNHAHDAAGGANHGHVSGAPQHGHDVSGVAHHGPAGAGHADGGHAHATVLDGAGGRWLSELTALASPRVLFSAAAGFGAAGQALAPVLGVLTLPVALAAGLAFERFLVRPYWNALFAFASKPALMLESTVLSRGQAVTDFDGSGSGLVSLEMDGQVRQVLGTLPASERLAGVHARRGDTLRVLSVDPRNGTCIVSRLE